MKIINKFVASSFLAFKRETLGKGAGRRRSSWREKTPRQTTKTPLRGGTERRRNRDRRKPWKTTADPGEPNERAATLQEKRGLSRYGVRDKGNRARGRRREVTKGATKGKGTKWGALERKEDRRESEKDKNSKEKYIYIYMNPEKREKKRTLRKEGKDNKDRNRTTPKRTREE
ncbi:hypothetical protein NDU88_003813 [Pleurodeles waltl]|uniref:Uncharacterized protein n=1 Tax=Pleurodeles waltl TaxID=8319 RepID=A0AAV7RDZ9_PLEWA|nr:hypothetical protein NDU88_003813 [Pleurodeles waltl]